MKAYAAQFKSKQQKCRREPDAGENGRRAGAYQAVEINPEKRNSTQNAQMRQGAVSFKGLDEEVSAQQSHGGCQCTERSLILHQGDVQ